MVKYAGLHSPTSQYLPADFAGFAVRLGQVMRAIPARLEDRSQKAVVEGRQSAHQDGDTIPFSGGERALGRPGVCGRARIEPGLLAKGVAVRRHTRTNVSHLL